jgi:hypothetical protein
METWGGRDLAAELSKPEVLAGLRLSAEADLAVDTANPALIDSIVRLTDRVGNLCVVIDHRPHLDLPAPPARDAYDRNLREFERRPQVYLKISQVLPRVDGRIPEDSAFHRARAWTSFVGFSARTACSTPAIGPTATGWRLTRRNWPSSGRTSTARRDRSPRSTPGGTRSGAYRWLHRQPGPPKV